MVDRIDMSLDDIIKTNKKSKNLFKAKGGGQGAQGVSGKSKKSRSMSRNRGGRLKSSGGIRKTKSRSTSRNKLSGTEGVKSGRRGRRGQSAGSIKRSRSRSGVRRQGGLGGLPSGGPGKLIISNLDVGVSDLDIQELFAEFGALKSADLHFDRNGKSLGTADVVFERRVDSVKAMKQYDGVPLDGKPMKIEMAASQGVVAGVAPGRPRRRSASMSRNRRSRSQARNRALGGVRGGRVTKRGVVRGYKQKGVNIAKKQPIRGITKARKIKVKGGGKKIGKKKSLPVSREVLDREIDSFMKSRVTES